MRKLLLLTFFISFVYKPAAQTLHLILAIDQNDRENALITAKSKEQATIMFETIAKSINYKLAGRYFVRNYFNTKALRDTLTSMKIDADDIVAFYYSGYGYHEKALDESFPYLSIPKENTPPLSIDEIGKILLKRGAKLNLVIADCIGKRQELEVPQIKQSRPTRVVSKKSKEIISNLMNSSCGLIKVSSQVADNKSFIVKPIRLKNSQITGNLEYVREESEQSVFAMSFFEVFEENLKKPNEQVKWPELFRNVQSRINEELNPLANSKRTQQMAFEYTPCKNVSEKMNLAWTNLPQTISVLESKLDQLIDIKSTESRAEFIKNFSKAFDPNKSVTFSVYLDRKSRTNLNPVKKVAYFMSIGDYLENLESYNPKLMSIKVVDRKNSIDAILPFANIVLEEFYNE